MNFFSGPNNEGGWITKLELTLLRGYILFQLVEKLVTLSIVQLRETAQKLGLL